MPEIRKTKTMLFIDTGVLKNQFNCNVKPVLGGVDGNLHFLLPFMNRSIKPSLQHFQFCRVDFLYGFFISLYFKT
jgi:hypothetical protein